MPDSPGMRVPLGNIVLAGGDSLPIEGEGFGPLTGRPAVILAGLHGDAADGIATAAALSALWRKSPPTRPVLLFGCLNPLAVLHGSHRWPGLDVDFATRLPGDPDGHPPDRIAAALFEHIRGAERVIELGAPDPGLWECAHAESWGDSPVPMLPVPAFKLSERPHPGSPGAWGAVRLRGGRTGRVHPAVVEMMTATVLAWLDGLPGAVSAGTVHISRAESAGIFIPRSRPGRKVVVGDVLGELANEPVRATVEGILFALRDEPTAYVGATLARILGAA